MRTSTLTRAGAVTAIAAAAGLAVAAGTAGASTPAPAPAKAAKTTLSVTAKKDVISGTLASGKKALAKEVVTLDTVAGKKLTVVGKAVTNKAGKVTFTVKPKASTKYELVFKGAGKLGGAKSSVVTITVAKAKPKPKPKG
jgi:hypothetical protein